MQSFKEYLGEDLRQWFKQKWVRMDTKGNIKGDCAREPGEGKPKCLPQAKAHAIGKKARASAAQRKRREDPNPERRGAPINVKTEACWTGYKRKPGTKAYTPGSCVKEDGMGGGAMSAGHPFIAKTVEIKMPSYYFIRINNDEFNYTTNPSYYRDRNRFLRKEHIMKSPYEFTYITTIGLYNNDGDLLAVAKLSKPIKKTSSTELVIKVKLDI